MCGIEPPDCPMSTMQGLCVYAQVISAFIIWLHTNELL